MVSRIEQLKAMTSKIEGLEAATKLDSDLFNMMMERVPKAIIIAKGEKFEHVSQHFADLLGRTREELCSKPWIEFVHPDDREPTTVVDKGIMTEGLVVIGFKNRYPHSDGHWVEFSWNASAWDDEYTFAWVEEVKEAEAA